MRPHEALDVANIIFSVVTYCPMNVITRLPSDVLNEFFSYLSRITCDFCRAAADENVCRYKMCIHGILHFFCAKFVSNLKLLFVSLTVLFVGMVSVVKAIFCFLSKI